MTGRRTAGSRTAGRRVAITGLGCVSCCGIGVPAFWASLAAGRSGLAPTTLTMGPHALTVPAGRITDWQPLQHFTGDELPLIDPFSQFALVAAREAMTEAGLVPGSFDPARTAVVLGSGLGGEQTRQDAFYGFLGEGRKRTSPTTVPRANYQASAGLVSMAYGITGPTLVVGTGCASANHAVAQAWLMLRAGLIDRALAGGSEAPLVFSAVRSFAAMQVLAHDTCRPFSAGRSGMVLAEGAGVAVLEDWDSAVARGATILAELAGVGMSADAGHLVHPTERGPVQAMRQALEQAGLAVEAVDYVNAHGTGTAINDAVEGRALHTVFGGQLGRLAVSATKSMHGHALGGSGGLELAATVLAIRHGLIPPTANFQGPDPNCPLDIVPNLARPGRIRAALSNAFAFGGLNAVLALRAV